MSHVWKKNESFEREKVVRGVYTTEQHRCLRCGLVREKTEGMIRKKKYKSYSYCRSGIIFGERKTAPICIDWNKEKENNNRID